MQIRFILAIITYLRYDVTYISQNTENRKKINEFGLNIFYFSICTYNRT